MKKSAPMSIQRARRVASTPDTEYGPKGKQRPRRAGAVRFLSYFSGPIIWAIEIAAVLLIIVTHSVDFVGVVIIANLVMIVIMMAFRAGLGLRQDSHGLHSLDTPDRTRSHGSVFHHG